MAKLRGTYACLLELAMALVGGKWKIVILWHLRDDRVLRFSALKRLLPGITQKMLTLQLREMEEVHLIVRTVYAEVPPRVEYSLTEEAKALSPVLEQLCGWSQAYAKAHGLKQEPSTACSTKQTI